MAVLGSSEPWCEAIALALNASFVVSIDYNYLTYQHERIQTISADQFVDFYERSEKSFDVILSISSVDHSGLARYSDELEPDGDLYAMTRTKSLLKPEGILILSVPIGPGMCSLNISMKPRLFHRCKYL